MPFSFDDSEFAEQADTAADEALEALEGAVGQEDSIEDPELADVDLRLATADYYRVILNHTFFDVDNPPAQVVDREIRAFIRERLEILLGLRDPRQPEVVSPFADEEVTALKLLAAKVLQKPNLVTEPAPVRKMPAPAAKAQVKMTPAPKPQARKIPAPAPAPSTKPKSPIQKKAAAPAAKPAAKQQKPQDPNATEQTFISHEGKQVTLVEGQTIEENGRRYIVAVNEKGTLYRKDVTGQVMSDKRLPPMTPQQLSIVSAQHAEAQVSALDQTTGIAVLASLRPE